MVTGEIAVHCELTRICSLFLVPLLHPKSGCVFAWCILQCAVPKGFSLHVSMHYFSASSSYSGVPMR